MIKIKELLPLYAVIFLGFLGYALTITLFIPMLMDKNGVFLAVTATTSDRASLSGLLLAMYPLGQFIGSPIIGKLSDQLGRKKVLLTSLIACAVGFIGMALSIKFKLLNLLFISAFFTGLCESNMAISQSVIADLTSDVTLKTKFIGYAFAACSLGYVVGPLIGGAGSALLSYSMPFWLTAFGVLAISIWVFHSYHDHYVPIKNTSTQLLAALTALKSIFNSKKIFKIYLINFSIFFAVQGLYRVVPLYVADQWRPKLMVYALLIAYVSLLCLIANLLILGKLAKRFSNKQLLSTLILLGGIIVICITLPKNFAWIWVLYGAAVVPTVMALPLCTTWLSHQVSNDEQGQVLGNLSSG